MKTYQTLHMDEGDAAREGHAWLSTFAAVKGADNIDMLSECQQNGGCVMAWDGRILLGYFLIVRDPMNWAVLVCHDLTELDKA